jgi:hypothetical protein
LFEGKPAFMNRTKIQEPNAEDAAEYQAVFMGALQSSLAAFPADYGESQGWHGGFLMIRGGCVFD